MIIVNGHLQICKTTGGGTDKGRPIPVSQKLSRKIPCNIKTVTNNLHGHSVDGVFRKTEFEVLIDTTETEIFQAEKVVLTNNRKQQMGTFWVQDVQHLDFVQAIKIDLAHAD